MATSFVALTDPVARVAQSLPLWLTVTVFVRDLLIVGGALFRLPDLAAENVPAVAPGKDQHGLPGGDDLPRPAVNYRDAAPWYMAWIYWITLFWTLASGVHYFIYGLAVLRERRRTAAASA